MSLLKELREQDLDTETLDDSKRNVYGLSRAGVKFTPTETGQHSKHTS